MYTYGVAPKESYKVFSLRRHFFVLRELQLTAYRTEEAAADVGAGSGGGGHPAHPAALSVGLKGCEIAPDVNIAQGRYGIRLSVPSQDGMSELWIKCENVSRTL